MSPGSNVRHLTGTAVGDPAFIAYDSASGFLTLRRGLYRVSGYSITTFGFDLTPEKVRGGEDDPGWFFILEQPPGQPRFGLDESAETGRDPGTLTSWNQIAWGDVVEEGEALGTLSHVKVAGRLLGHQIGGLEWGRNAGHMAAITLQRPVRVLLHASKLLPPEEAGDDA